MFITFFFRKSCHLWNNVEKYGRARQATGYNIIWRMRIACWISKATDTLCEYWNSYWLPTEIVVTPTLLNITFVRTSPVLLLEIFTVFFKTLMYQRICESRVRIRASDKIWGWFYFMIIYHFVTLVILLHLGDSGLRNVRTTGYIGIVTSTDRISCHFTAVSENLWKFGKRDGRI